MPDAEALELSAGVTPPHIDIVHPREWRAAPQIPEKRIDRPVVACGGDVDRAVATVSHPSPDPVSPGTIGRELPEADALHTPADNDLDLLHTDCGI